MIRIYELNWAPGNYQWECDSCKAVGNITPPMILQPSASWHKCETLQNSKENAK